MTLDIGGSMILDWHLTKEEYEAEINDFLYGITVTEGREELTEDELQHLKDLYESKQIAPSIYDL